jgi:uncharacterized protein (TIGR03067 family)
MRRVATLALALGLVAADKPPDATELDGTWVMVSGEQDGVKLPADAVKVSRLTIKGDRHTVKLGEDTLVGTHKLGKGTIDATDKEGPFMGKSLKGIYRVKGDELTVCFAAPGEPRPTEFKSGPEAGHLLHVWKRQKR